MPKKRWVPPKATRMIAFDTENSETARKSLNGLTPDELKAVKGAAQELLEESIKTDDFDEDDWEAIETRVHADGVQREDAIAEIRELKDNGDQ